MENYLPCQKNTVDLSVQIDICSFDIMSRVNDTMDKLHDIVINVMILHHSTVQ